ncbi:PAS domain S-box protein [Halorussus marinus]|uniref:PAS domain S-box protein n=1 Tax=Halorussus marinus TaxID=2505976 RepID=UPI00142FFD79|nr:PAS domain S-box protein [Halorussus marinus]
MGYLSRGVEAVGGRRFVLGLGGLYVAVAVGFPVVSEAGRSADELQVVSLLVGLSGIVLLYGGYRLPESDIRPDLYHVVAVWCLRAVGVIVGVLLLIAAVSSLTDPLGNFLILSSLASVAGLGMGYHDGQGRTRAVDAEEYSRQLERYRTIVEAVDDGIFVADADNRFRLVNDAYTELVGYDREELLGAHTSLVANETERADDIIEEVERNLTPDSATPSTYETALQTATGETITAEWSVAPLARPDGGDPDRAVIVRDVTERNERERRLERQNERLDSFASLLAHELRNPVNIGQIYSRQLDSATDPEAVEYVTEAFDRIEDMIDIMLLVTRGGEAVSEPSTVRLDDVAREAWTDLNASEATLTVETDASIEADDTYTRHLFRNLFENAIEHGGDGVTVTVGDLPDGFYVADDGVGIGPAERETVFETGYTSAADRGGMGLGLTFVQEMADVYGWRCSVTESADGGARFEFERVAPTRRVTD